MRRGAKFLAAVVAVVGVGFAGSATVATRASAEAAPDARIDQLAVELGGLDGQVSQLGAALEQADRELAVTISERDEVRQDVDSREQLEARLVGQARAYAVQRYMYGSTDSTDLLAFVAALNKPADDAVWGLAALEVATDAAHDQAEQVARARAAVEDRLATLESDVVNLRTVRARRAQELALTTAQRADVALQFEALVRDLGQATVNGMTTVAYQAYRRAADTLALEQPGCGLRWELLAAIGKTESNHGAGRVDGFGNSLVAIVGIPIGPDTDGGLFDGDAASDHAVGPMQFLPSTWKRWGTDANADGKADPGNVLDAATAAGRYLCRAAGDLTLTTEPGVTRAILAYNPNQAYLRIVGARFEALASDLARGWFSAANLPPPPPLASDFQPNGGPGGRSSPGSTPLPAPPQTILTAVEVFTATGLANPTPGPAPEAPGDCLGASLVLDGRGGFLRCQPAGGPVLDPCEVAPYDATLVGCLPDPTGLPVLVRLPTAASVSALAPPPPYRLLVLDGGERCLPIPAAAEPPQPPSTTTTTTAKPSRRGTTTSSPGPTTPSTDVPTSTGGRTTRATSASAPTASPMAAEAAPITATTASSQRARATAASTSSSAPAKTTTTATTSTSAPAKTTTTATTPTSAPAKTTTTNTTTATTTTTVVTTTTVPVAERPTYTCAGAATVIGLPDSSASTWSVLVRQAGLADRRLTLVTAYA